MGKLIKILFLSAIMVTAAIGCSKDKGDKRANVSNRWDPRNNGYQQNPHRNNQNPSQGEWGTIYNNSGSFPALNAFMVGINDLGYVSGRENDTTGIRFRGQVNEHSRSGTIDILVWDQNANTGAEPLPYYWSTRVRNVQSTGSRVIIEVEDSAGMITFDGTATNTQYSGTVSFRNSDGYSGTLGQFRIYTCALLSCN